MIETDFMKVFLDVENLQVMYHLAKYAPMTKSSLNKKLKPEYSLEELGAKLDKLVECDLAFNENDKWDLTEKGYCALYNFHECLKR